MKNPKYFFLILPFLFLLQAATAQSTTPTSSPPRLYIKEKVNKGPYVEIVYEVNKPGFVELHLFDSDRKKLWIKGDVVDRIGLAKVRIPTKPLEVGKFYPFTLKYKGKDYNGTIFYD